MWRGRPSSFSTRPKIRSRAPLPLAQPGRPQLGEVAQRHPGVARPDVRERLRDRVGLARRHPERGADVTDRVAHLVGLHHRHARAALGAVAVEDRLVDLQPPRGLHVEVDVGQRGAQRREEPLHQQVVPDRVDPGDPEQVVDQAARARPARRAPDAELADQVGDVADGEEVRREAEPADDLQLVGQPLPDPLPGCAAVAPADRGLAPRPQCRVGRRVTEAGGVARARPGLGPATPRFLSLSKGELREVHLAQPEVLARVEHAPVGDRAGVREQPGAVVVAVEAGVAADLLGDLVHLLAGLEEPFGVAAVEMADVERDQPAGGVEDVDGGGVGPVGVADRVGQHHREPGCPAQPGHPGGVGGRAGTAAGDPVGDRLDQEVVRADRRAPAVEHRPAEVVATQRGRPAELGGGTEQHQDVLAGDVLGDQVERADRVAALAGEVGRGDQPAQRRPAAATAGQERDPGQPGVTEGAAADRSPSTTGGCGASAFERLDGPRSGTGSSRRSVLRPPSG